VYEISFFEITRRWANPKGLETEAFSSLLTVVEVTKEEVERHQSHHVNQMAGKTLTSSTATALTIKIITVSTFSFLPSSRPFGYPQTC
jgi:hypothetical protein